MFMDFFLGEAIVCFVAVVSLGSPIFAVTWLRATFAPWFGTALRLSVCCSSHLPLASATKAAPPKASSHISTVTSTSAAELLVGERDHIRTLPRHWPRCR